jgi:hypothetical protein
MLMETKSSGKTRSAMTEGSGVNSVTFPAILKGGKTRFSSNGYGCIQSYYDAFKSAMPEDMLPTQQKNPRKRFLWFLK